MSTDLVTAFTTAITTIQGDVVNMVKAALPGGLIIMGIFLASRLGVAFFKSIAK